MNTSPPDANPPLRLLMTFNEITGHPQPDWLVQAPGREMWVAATVQDGHEFELSAPDINARGTVTFSHRSAKGRRTVLNRPLPSWARYPAGVLVTLGDSGLQVPGITAMYVGNEPPGPRFDFAVGLAFAALGHELTETAFTADALEDIVERVRRTYIQR